MVRRWDRSSIGARVRGRLMKSFAGPQGWCKRKSTTRAIVVTLDVSPSTFGTDVRLDRRNRSSTIWTELGV